MTINNIILEMRSLTDSDATSYPASALTDVGTRRINAAYEQIVGWIINADGTWQFDDLNYTTLPIGTITLVEGQTSYSYTDKFLQVEEVSVLDVNGKWRKLKLIDPNELGELSIEEYFGITTTTPKGLPMYYDKQANNIKLYLAPTSTSVTLASGLRVRFKRTAQTFTAAEITTGTKEPGFASPYHIILAYMAAIPYCMSYKKDRVAFYEQKVLELKDEIIKHYSNRERDLRPRLTMAQRAFK